MKLTEEQYEQLIEDNVLITTSGWIKASEAVETDNESVTHLVFSVPAETVVLGQVNHLSYVALQSGHQVYREAGEYRMPVAV